MAGESAWKTPGIPSLLAATAIGFSGFAVLLPTAPMRALELGAGAAGAGQVNAVLMLFTVVAQLSVPPLLRRLGWGPTFTAGLLLLGLPSLAMPIFTQMTGLLAMSGLRGLGFGVVTVCGSTAVAMLVPPALRGRAVGAYGLAIALPQFLLTPLAPMAMESTSFVVVCVIGGLPVAALPWVPGVARHLGMLRVPRGGTATATSWRGLIGSLWPSILALIVITAGGGAVLTFATETLSGAGAAAWALAMFTGVATIGRWLIGGMADRWGPTRFIAPILLLGAMSFGVFGWSAAQGQFWLTLVASCGAGAAYGALQNLTLVEAFARGGEGSRARTSVAWNVGFDAGTGLGALTIGQLAGALTFSSSFAVMGVAVAVVAVLHGLPAIRPLRHSRRQSS